MKASYQYFICVAVLLAMLLPSVGNCSPLNRELSLIGIQVRVKNSAIAIFESADGDSISCKRGCVLANNMTVTKIARSGVMVRGAQGEFFIPVGSNVDSGGIKGDMLDVPVFQVYNDPSSTFAAASQSSAFAPLPDISAF
jgi:hypothetical protein